MQSIFLIGPMGAGKSTIGKYLAQELQWHFFDTDRLVEKRAGASAIWIFDIEGEAGFQKREQKVLQEFANKKSIVLATGASTVASADNRKLLQSKGIVIYLKVNLPTQIVRTAQDSRRPQLAKKHHLQQTLSSLHSELTPLYSRMADYTFETNDISAQNLARLIAQQVAEHL